MQTENFTQFAIAWKTEMSDKLSNTEISNSSTGFKTDRNIWNPNLVMKERHKMGQEAKVHQIKLFQLPKETMFVEASRLIRKENSEMLLRAKEENMVKRAILSLEKSFSEYRNSTTFSLLEFERLNKGKEKVRYTKNTHTFEKIKQMNSENFLKNFQKIYKDIQCQKSNFNNQSEHNVCCNGLDKSVKHSEDKSLERNSKISLYGEDIANAENDGTQLIHSGSAENEIRYFEYENEQKKLYPSPKETSPSDNSEKETSSQNSEMQYSENSDVFHKFNLMRYWKAWRKFILTNRIDKEKSMRMKKIDQFLQRLNKKVVDNDKIAATKNLCEVKHSKTATRKTSGKTKCVKLASVTERDEHLDRIEDELNKSAVEAYEQLRRGLKNFHPRLRPKVKVLSALPNIDKTSKAPETKRSYPIPLFLMRMENRYKERKKRWEDIDRRKRQIQAEKEQIEKEREEEKMKMEELRKKEKLEELVKKRLEKKKAEEEREMRKQQLKMRIKLAQEHYEMYLTKRIGFEPWKNLIQIRRAQIRQAHHHSDIRTLKLHIKHWRNFTHQQIKQKCEKADRMFSYILLKRSFTLLINDYNETVKKLQVALDWWDAKITEKIFKIWLAYTRKERWDTFRKQEIANSNYNRVITSKYFTMWKKFPEYMRNQKQKEIRRRLLQRRVQEFLPDYQPAAYVNEI